MELSERKGQILATIIDTYIQTGEPVGSKVVAEKIDYAFSSATIRNEMSALTSLGLLEQPHTSSGRVPSYHGYQFYIENLLPNKKVSLSKQREIDAFFSGLPLQDVETFIENAAEGLGYFTNYTCIATSPQSFYKIFGQVELLQTKAAYLVVVLTATSGYVDQMLVRMPKPHSKERYEQLEEKINRKLERVPLARVTAEIFADLGDTFFPLFQSIEKLSKDCAEGHLIVSGFNRLFNNDMYFCNPRMAMEMVYSDHLKNLLELTGVYPRARVIGNTQIEGENPKPVGLIAAKYHVNTYLQGTIGIVGSAGNIVYSEMIPYVNYFAREMGHVLRANLRSDVALLESEVDA